MMQNYFLLNKIAYFRLKYLYISYNDKTQMPHLHLK